MHILYLHQHFSTLSGAAGTRSYEFAKKLIKMGHTVTVVCGDYDRSNVSDQLPFESGVRKYKKDEINIIQFQIAYSNSDSFIKRSMIFLKFVLKTIKIVLTHDYDFVFATSTPLTIGIPAIVGKLLRNKDFVFEVRDLWPKLPEKLGIVKNKFLLKGLYFLEKLSYKYSVACIGLAPGIVEGIKRYVGDKKEVILIPNGCDVDLFNDEHILPLRPTGVSSSDFLVIYTGAHGIANDLQSVLYAAEKLIKENRFDIKFCFIGSGMLKASLIDYASKNSLSNCIFLDPIEKTKLVQYMKGADLGLQVLKNLEAFYNGTSPNKFFDYLSASLPVLCNYPGWISDIILQNNCGVVVQPNSANEFAQRLKYLADNRHLLKDMGKNSLLVAKRDFNRKDLSLKFVKFLEKVYLKA